MTIKFIGEFIEKDSYESYVGEMPDDMTDEEMEEFEEQKAKFERQLKENDAEYVVCAKFYSFEFVNDYDLPEKKYLIIFKDYDNHGADMYCYDGINAAIGDAGSSVLAADNKAHTDFWSEPSVSCRYYLGEYPRIEWEEGKNYRFTGDKGANRVYPYDGTDDDVVLIVKDYLEENIDTKYVEKNMANLTFDKEAKEVEKK